MICRSRLRRRLVCVPAGAARLLHQVNVIVLDHDEHWLGRGLCSEDEVGSKERGEEVKEDAPL